MNSSQGAATDANWRRLFRTLGENVCTHLTKRCDHAIHGTSRETGVSDEAALKCLSGEEAGEKPHRRPRISAIDVLLGGVRTRFFPWTISVSGAGCSILTPKARIALTVRMQSSLGRNPCRVHTPLDKAAMITARCEMLLSPGTVISMSIRGARLIRSSIDEL